uniref:Histidine--tRNA ligase, chloroplastic n=1 Tax=Polysiphonia sertularioides TaxID=945028 RepID=A0A1Z1MGQ6_9FLOR|nr:Histidine-tRNA ligase [Polysiphonia sertularioides]
MQPLRGTKDILPSDIQLWQKIYEVSKDLFNEYNYEEIRTPIIENTELFKRSIGNLTDIVNKEMYSFNDQGSRRITLRPEGTSSVARAIISNKIHLNNKMNRLWYLGPMFRYERPQKGRQRQFHQLGIECTGSDRPLADAEVIKLAIRVLRKLDCYEGCKLEINSIGNIQEREVYTNELKNYLRKYINELDEDSQKRVSKNPLRILDTKDQKTQEILQGAPLLNEYLSMISLRHFTEVCETLEYLNIDYSINHHLVRGLDYYNYTAFEIKTDSHSQQNTICGGGRYDGLTKQLGGPLIPAVGWAIGIERLIMLMEKQIRIKITNRTIYIATQKLERSYYVCDVINTLNKYHLKFDLDINNNDISKKIKKASQLGVEVCFILGQKEIDSKSLTIKWMKTNKTQLIRLDYLKEYIHYLSKVI